ncbi:YbaB/EbfC family nucleoid-associated protein [Mycobacterium sp. 21AC1]|uniref:YbaB/EbfC family nucleoid-associated protein n=1 Tax=[Mycobacterium] appelbergii TaxID=2939269 RepID=UPI002938F6A8|nr:YbaB/EbfC family nucleoid-associated protein [Mycobacterium sp. 21AC1]MDV3124029.1 YbaB/EbfC family nucleoid-associated protein [Mycobacterium sp. 21AC1]
MTGLADSLVARIRKQRDLVQAMDEHCQSISARVTSRDENVSVEVDGLGEMTGLWMGPAAHKLGAEALAKLIVETAQAAAQVAAARQQYLTEEFACRLEELKQAPLTRWDGTTFEPDG